MPASNEYCKKFNRLNCHTISAYRFERIKKAKQQQARINDQAKPAIHAEELRRVAAKNIAHATLDNDVYTTR